MLSEARLALVVSIAALLVATCQALEARRANALNEDSMSINVLYATPFYFSCDIMLRNGELAPVVAWEVLLTNNSIQPALLTSISVERLYINGAKREPESNNPIPTVRLPLTLAPKAAQAFTVKVPFDPAPSVFDNCLRKGMKGEDTSFDVGPILNFVDPRQLGVVIRVKTSSNRQFSGIGSLKESTLRSRTRDSRMEF